MDFEKLLTIVDIVTAAGPPPKRDDYNIYKTYIKHRSLNRYQLVYLLELYRPRAWYN